MQNRVGSSNPTKDQVDGLLKKIDEVRAETSKYTVSLTAEERQRTTKFRTGGERIVELMAELANVHNVALPGISVSAMRSDMELAQTLRPLATTLRSLAETVDDTVKQAESECWWSTTAYYTALVRMADTDPKLADSLRPVIDFFARRRKTPEPK